jgi:hypothetical protein
VRHADGRVRRYTYAGDLLTSVQDERGRYLIRNEYRASRIASQEYLNGGRYAFHYKMADNDRYVQEATIALPDGRSRSIRVGDSVPQILKDLSR